MLRLHGSPCVPVGAERSHFVFVLKVGAFVVWKARDVNRVQEIEIEDQRPTFSRPAVPFFPLDRCSVLPSPYLSPLVQGRTVRVLR